ncbi:MAG: competence/damage-inducible protein A [Pegethrix bostrychoides GSE-TBD4-15B]|jgi:nicotinamide-nucleotide amidase|uniref:CinA-like protein n=1 Tax=Pegethrix bostrychoides GSE-TBD4-15B TaxID=2839662 RepID=A0A951U4J8_9CYAN|nr:competence/damage-inducible protein A [Pegethrix bostrychoides GSE-TBD4-15B]
MTATNVPAAAEIITVGTELLLGEILNSNAQFLAQELAKLGVPHYYQTVVGDNVMRLQKAVAIGCERARILIFTGGLGPTPDDLTTETLADFFQTPLIERADVLEEITQKFARRGRAMSPSNRKQALLPEGAEVLPNPTGSAPGMIWQPRPGLILLTFPGVPSEMQVMWRQTAVPFLISQGWGQEVIYSRVLRFWGIGESTLAEKVAEQIRLQNPTVAPYAGKGEVRLRISSKARTEAEAMQVIDPVVQQIQQIAGADFYGIDQETLASAVGHLLQRQGQTVAVAESCTGGGLGQFLTETPGSSAYFRGGIISYDNQIKIELLGVEAAVLAEQGAVSAAVAEQMAVGARDRLKASWGLSITGVAGPDGGSDEKPVGLVYLGIAAPTGSVVSFRYLFGSSRSREMIRWMSLCTVLDLLRRQLISG